MKWISIIGARPHFMKLAPLEYELRKHSDIEHLVLHSGQHYDASLSQNFLKEFHLNVPKYNLRIGSGTANYQIGTFLTKIDEILDFEKPDLIIVYGDTNTTGAGAIAGASRQIPVAHVEAGLREWNKNIPEEINKLITDAVADYFFCPTSVAVQNLQNQGIENHVYLTGDITLDLLADQEQYIGKNELFKKYQIESDIHLFTCHRASNTNNPIHLKEIVAFLNHTNYEMVWPMHPRMKEALIRHGWSITNAKVKLTEPISYWETQSLIKVSRMVVTDSGGIIKEAYFHKTPAIIIDQQTEWTEAIDEGWHRIAGPDSALIQQFMDNIPQPKTHTNAFGDGHAAEKIVSILKNQQ